jgi:MPBQ/MSBQ methyltransferase
MVAGVGLIQHKREAYWFYRFLSVGYDRWVNPLFWTPAMRDRALDAARLDDPGLATLDVGAGTGFTTEGIVQRIAPANVTMLDQSPHQLARARAKPELAACAKVQGDAENLPFPDDTFDRVISAGSIEYWPDPQAGIGELYRVTKPGGWVTVIGPVKPSNPVLRRLADTWMLFPGRDDYWLWMQSSPFFEIEFTELAPDWYRGRSAYALAVTGTKNDPGGTDLGRFSNEDREAPIGLLGRVRFACRFVAGSAVGALFVPIGAVLALRARLTRKRRA